MPDWQAVAAGLLVAWALAYSLRALLPARWRRGLANGWSRWRGIEPGADGGAAPAGACGTCQGCAGPRRARGPAEVTIALPRRRSSAAMRSE